MREKILITILLFVGLGVLSGCYRANANEIPDIIEEVDKTKKDKSERVEHRRIKDYEMKGLFEIFLDLDEELILVLNQKPKTINSEYWEAYENYEIETKKTLDKYLSDSAENQLSKQYLQDEFDFFRFIQMNDHLITCIDSVEDTKIISKEVKEDKTVYEVEVQALASTINYDLSKKRYIWDDEKGYYTDNIILDLPLDQIKLILNYYVSVPHGESFKVSSIKEKENLHVGMEESKNIKNNGFARRIPYLRDPLNKHEEKIYKFLDVFMKQDYNYYNYYRKVHDTNFETMQINLENDLGLSNIISLDKEKYKTNFNTDIIPLKDNMKSLDFIAAEDITVLPHISSSKQKTSYKVILETEVTLLNKDKVAYEYTYLFTLESGIISSIRALSQNELENI